ncbi:MAG: isochorismatase family protein [Phycisphaerae bacterium]|nr:isochorismatase family protein [Phycisphaerae bacterium]
MRNVRKMGIFVDMCTQRDYLASDGAHPSLNAAQIRSNLKRLMALARWAKVPTLSCVDARRPEDVRGLPRADCVIGTPGQRKLSFSLLPDHVLIDSDNCLCVSLDILNQHQQAILTKEHRDPFTNPKLDRLLTELPSRRFIVFGVPLESSIRLLTLGLMLRHRRVTLIHDACGWWDAEEGEMTLRQLAAKGCELTTTQDLIASVLAQYKPARTNGQRRRRSVA